MDSLDDQLFEAASDGLLETLEEKLKLGASPNATGDVVYEPHTALMAASIGTVGATFVAGGHLSCVQRLLAAGADPNRSFQSSRGGKGTALNIAATYCSAIKSTEIIRALIAAGASLEAKNGYGLTSVEYVVAQCEYPADPIYLEAIEVLAKAGASLSNALRSAQAAHKDDVASRLVELGAMPA